MSKHTIWSNINLDVDDWRDDVLAEYPDMSEEEIYSYMLETNESYLDDERMNLDEHISEPMVIIADFGLWNGRQSAYKVIEDAKLNDIFLAECEYHEWYGEDGEIRGKGIHHDGTNYYTYRAVTDLDDLEENGPNDSNTRPLYADIANVYGWSD